MIFSVRPQLAWICEILEVSFGSISNFLEGFSTKKYICHHSKIAMAKVGYSIRSTNRIIVVRAGFRAFCNKYMTMIKAIIIRATKATAEMNEQPSTQR